jgi:hypothetical protein
VFKTPRVRLGTFPSNARVRFAVDGEINVFKTGVALRSTGSSMSAIIWA